MTYHWYGPLKVCNTYFRACITYFIFNSVEYISKVVLLFIGAKHKEVKLEPDHPTFVIFNKFTGQLTDSACLFSVGYQQNLPIKALPNCIDRLQLIDLSVNKLAKDFLCAKFCVWYSEQAEQKLTKCDTSIVDTIP